MSDDNTSSLFRQEVLAAQSDMAKGRAMAITPVGSSFLTFFFAILCAGVIATLFLGSYTNKETVQGEVQPVDGVAVVSPPDSGMVKRLLVKEGQTVQAGDVLAEVSNERFSDAGSTEVLVEGHLEDQKRQVLAQTESQGKAQAAALASLDQRVAQAQRTITTLAEEMRLQTQQVASARKLFDQLEPLRAERIVSDLQYEQQRQSLLEQSSRLQTLKRQQSDAQAEIAQARDEQKRLLAQHEVERSTLGRDLLGLEQEQVQRRSTHVMLLKAPIAGTVSGLVASVGQRVTAGETMASVVPTGSAMQAVLYVPSTAMGFIKPGQTVRVRYDAFPHQRFGQYAGVVKSVSQSDVPLPASMRGSPDQRARFLVRVDLAQPYVKAYGQTVPLRPGHTLTADIELDRRRLIRWLFDPLATFSGKL